MFFRKVIVRWLCVCLWGLVFGSYLRAQGVMSLSLTIVPDTIVQYGDSVKFTVRVAYDHPSETPFFGWVSFKYQTPLGVFDSITPVPSSYLIVGSGGFINTTFFIPVSPSAFTAGGGGNPIVIWPVLVPDTSLTPGSVTVKDSIKTTLYVLPLSQRESEESRVLIFPNPVSDYLFLKFNDPAQSYTIFVYDGLGRLIDFQAANLSTEVTLNALRWPEGMVVLRIMSPSGMDSRRKILCRRH